MQISKLGPYVVALRFRLRQAAVMWLHTILKKPVSYTYVSVGFMMRAIGMRCAGLKFILKGRRVSNVAWANTIIKNLINDGVENSPEFFELLGDVPKQPIEDFADWLLILKLPILVDSKVIEKGAVIFKFSEMFAPMYLLLDTKLLSRYFRIILEPSSVGYSLPEILAWETLSPEKVIVLSPYKDDFQLLSSITNNLVPTTLGPADWVDTSRFYRIPDVEKYYDVIYVANFNPIKRVDRYIRAIDRISNKRPDYKAALVCAAKTGSVKREVLATLESAKNRAAIDYIGGVDQAGLNVLFNKSKVNVLVSLREGANKGLAEGLFSSTPALIIKENAGGNHLHINEMTGKIVSDSELEKNLIWFADHYDEYESQEWSLKHISPSVSIKALSEKIKNIELSDGGQWTKDLFAKVNSPELAYLNSSNSWLLSEREELLARFSRGGEVSNVSNFVERLQKMSNDLTNEPQCE